MNYSLLKGAYVVTAFKCWTGTCVGVLTSLGLRLITELVDGRTVLIYLRHVKNLRGSIT